MPLNRVFALVGIMFGALFVLINAPDLPGPWPWVARVLGAALVLVAVQLGVRRTVPTHILNARPGVRVYWFAVAAELIAIPVGSMVISQVFERPELTVTWVVFVVGVHFLPARRFGFPRWTTLGLVMLGLAIGGALGALVSNETWAPASAVLAGLAMLIFVANPAPPSTQQELVHGVSR